MVGYAWLNIDDLRMTDMTDAILVYFGGCMFDLVATYIGLKIVLKPSAFGF